MDSLSPRLKILPTLIFTVLGLVLYANSLEVPFYFDDLNQIEKNGAVQIDRLSFQTLYDAAFHSTNPRRFVANISLALNYYVHQFDVEGYHWVNIFIHIGTGCLLFLLLRLTLATPALKNRYPNPALIAFLGALLWFSSPLHTQSVTYIIQRMNSLSAFFYLLAFILYIAGRLHAGGPGRLALYAGCAVAWVFALGSKENAVTLPFFILLYEWYFFHDLSLNWLKRRAPLLIGACCLFVAVAVAYLGINAVQFILSHYESRDFTLTERVLTQFRVLVHYLGLIAWPHPGRLNLDYDFPLSRSLVDPLSTLISAVFLLCLLLAAIYAAKKHRLLSFAILWFFGQLILESSVIPLEIIYEHRTYLPSMFLVLIPVVLLHDLIRSKAAIVIVVSCSVVLFGSWTVARNAVWRDPEVFWKDCIAKSPGKPRPHSELGMFYLKEEELEKAAASLAMALERDPAFADAHVNLGVVRFKEGNLKDAAAHFSDAARLRPHERESHLNLGKVLFMQDEPRDSVSPATENFYFLGRAFMALDQPERAAQQFAAILRVEPENPVARKRLREAQSMVTK